MKFFADIRTKRHTAIGVLLVWLFALASGVANACLLEIPDLYAQPAARSAVTADRDGAESAAHPSPSAGHHGDTDDGKESCLKVCDDGTHTLNNASPGVDQADPGAAPLFATLWTGFPLLVSVSHRPDEWAIPIVGPPFRVRYSRLAL